MDTAKVRFLFGTDDPGFDVHDEEQVGLFFVQELAAEGEEDEDDDGDAMGRAVRAILLTGLANQIRDDDPPQAWATASRLVEAGLDRRDALDQMCVVFSHLIEQSLEQGRAAAGAAQSAPGAPPLPRDGVDLERYGELLDGLPLADVDELTRRAVARAAAHQGIALEELREQLVGDAAKMGSGVTELAELAVGMALGELDGPFSELALVAGGRVVHLPSLTEEVVLTYRLGEVEAEGRRLLVGVASDLAAFAWHGELRTVDGVAVGPVDLGPAEIGWLGEGAWLDGAEGDLVAVRARRGAGEHAVVSLEPLGDAEPHVPESLLAALRAAYEAALEETGEPVPLTALVAAVLLDHPSAFRKPVAPLVELCAAAGLEHRAGHVADDPHVWSVLADRQRSERVHDAFDWDHARAHRALAVLELVGEEAAPADLRAALATLADEETAQVVAAELIGNGVGAEGWHDVETWSQQLVDVARRPAERMAAGWLAGVVAEESGRVLDAERHLKAALEADNSWGSLVDRVAWYASDRGDGARAAQLWRLLESPEGPELAVVERAVGDVPPKIGRNDPCWCGSGRKSKACHRGQAPRAPIEARAEWLYQKAVSYVLRQDAGPDDLASLAVLCAEAAVGQGADEDEPSVTEEARRWVGEPIVTDGTLAELGWFERFAEARRALLPEDEAELLDRWAEAERSVFEVVDLGAEWGTATVRPPSASGEAGDVDVVGLRGRAGLAPGGAVCGRLLPAGGVNLLAGAFAVPERHVEATRALCAEGDIVGLCYLVATGELRVPVV